MKRNELLHCCRALPMRPILRTQMCHMTSLATFTTRNMVSNWAVISRMLIGESLICFTVWTGHLGWQVRAKKSRRVGSIFSSSAPCAKHAADERAKSDPLNDPCRWKTRLHLPICIWIEDNFRIRLLLNHSKDTLSQLLTHFCHLTTR